MMLIKEKKKKEKKFSLSYDNFLDLNLIKEIDAYVVASQNLPRWKNSHFWEKPIKRSTSPIAILDIPDEFNTTIQQRLKKIPEISWREDNPPRRSMYYLYPPGGYIGWHDDSKYEFASIICLNKVWDPNWGGIHLYEDLKGLGIRGEIPTFNKGLVHSGGVPHGVSILAPEAPFRRMIITFGPLGPSFPHPKANEADKKWREWKRKRNVGAVCFKGIVHN